MVILLSLIVFFELVSHISLTNTVILGDFNFHIGSDNTAALSFNNILQSLSLTQHVSEMTHISNNILDLIISSSFHLNYLTILPLNFLFLIIMLFHSF